MSHFALKERYWVHALEKIGKIAFHMIQFWTLLEGGSGYLYIDISNISRGENSVVKGNLNLQPEHADGAGMAGNRTVMHGDELVGVRGGELDQRM